MSLEEKFFDSLLDMNDLHSAMDESDEKKNQRVSWEDFLIDGLESLTSLFDNIYILRSFGIISESNVLYQKLNRGDFGSKLWFISSLLSTRKSLSQLIVLGRSRYKLLKEYRQLMACCTNSLRKTLITKIRQSLRKVDVEIKKVLLELIQNLAYLLLITVDIFKLHLSRKWKRLLEAISVAATILRLLSSGITSVPI
ncbi:LAFE_0G00452g1_1 [Lachancea fermentati]|uniref:LAFE_0G00452g1_1 n=1 Tax=Lachancea fermentati TaxID=4955 RepID=A0A1G4MGE3_LACFM|nr:LAFE_0G00452g1_1 [Lachancea fermentati]